MVYLYEGIGRILILSGGMFDLMNIIKEKKVLILLNKWKKIYAKFMFIGLIGMLLVGCGSSNIQFQGKTVSDSVIKKDTITNIRYLTKIYGCDKFERVETSIVSFDEKKKISKEIWKVYGCNKKFEFDVRYQNDPKGGTFIGISKRD